MLNDNILTDDMLLNQSLRLFELKLIGDIDYMIYKGKCSNNSDEPLNSRIHRLNFDVKFKNVVNKFSIFSKFRDEKVLINASVIFSRRDIPEILNLVKDPFIHSDINIKEYPLNDIKEENLNLYYNLYCAIKDKREVCYINDRCTLFYTSHINHIITINDYQNYIVDDIIKYNFSKMHVIENFDKWLNENVFSDIVSFENSKLCLRGKKIKTNESLANLKHELIQDNLWALYCGFNERKNV